MQSEVTGHIGAQGNYPCRKCHIGGSTKDKETDEGFHSLFEVCHGDFCICETSLSKFKNHRQGSHDMAMRR
jgi:hypothetical protein